MKQRIVLVLLCAVLSYGFTHTQGEWAKYKVIPSGIIKGGTVFAEMLQIAPDEAGELLATVKISGKVNTSFGTQTKVKELSLPLKFFLEETYQMLESSPPPQEIVYDKVKITFLGRENITAMGRIFENCYKILMVKDGEEGEMLAWFHPDVSTSGWVKANTYVPMKEPNIKGVWVNTEITDYSWVQE